MNWLKRVHRDQEIKKLFSFQRRSLALKACSVITSVAFFFNILSYDIALSGPLQKKQPATEGQAWAIRVPPESSHVGSGVNSGPGTPQKLTIKGFTLPEYLGVVTDRFSPPAKEPDKIVVLIQDAHCNYAAQKKIAEIVRHFNKLYRVRVVNMEGGKGDYNLSIFLDIGDKKVREEVSDYFVKEGQISGAEYFAINDPFRAYLWGVETSELYLENLKVYRESLGYRGEVEYFLDSLTYILNNLKRHIYSKELLDFDNEYSRYKAGDIKFKDYVNYLLSVAKEKKVYIKNLLHLYLLYHSIAWEGEIDFKRADHERDILISRLEGVLSGKEMDELINKTVEFRNKRLSQTEFYGYLLKKAEEVKLDLADFPEFKKYLGYIFLYHVVDRAKVMEEIGILENAIKGSLYENDKQKELDLLSKHLTLTKNFFDATLTRSDYEYYEQNKLAFETQNYISFIEKEAPKYKITAQLPSDIQNLDFRMAEMDKFYEYSFKRDLAFLDNIKFNATESPTSNIQQPTSILITGGFHAENLCKLFKENDIAYICIMPNFTSEEGYVCPYFDLLAGERPQVEMMISDIMGYSLAIASILSQLGPDVYDENARRIFGLHVQWKRAVAEGKGGLAIMAEDGRFLGAVNARGEIVPEDRSKGFEVARVPAVVPAIAPATPELVDLFGNWFDLNLELDYFSGEFERGEAKGLAAIQEGVQAERGMYPKEEIEGGDFYFDLEAFSYFSRGLIDKATLAEVMRPYSDKLPGQINVIVVDKGPKAVARYGNTIAINRAVFELTRGVSPVIRNLITMKLLDTALRASSETGIREGEDLGISLADLRRVGSREKPDRIMEVIRQVFSPESKLASDEQEENLILAYDYDQKYIAQGSFNEEILKQAIKRGFTTVIVRFLEGDVIGGQVEVIFANKSDVLVERIDMLPENMDVLFSAVGENMEPGSVWRFTRRFLTYDIKRRAFLAKERPRIMTYELERKLEVYRERIGDRELEGRNFGYEYKIERDEASPLGRKVRIDLTENPPEGFESARPVIKAKKYTYEDIYEYFNFYHKYWMPKEGHGDWELSRFLREIVASDLTPEEKREKILGFFEELTQGQMYMDGKGVPAPDKDPLELINGEIRGTPGRLPFEERLLAMLKSPPEVPPVTRLAPGKGVLDIVARGVFKVTDPFMAREDAEDLVVPVVEEGIMFLALAPYLWGGAPSLVVLFGAVLYFLLRAGFIAAHALQDRAPPGRRRTIFERIIIPALISVPAFSLPVLALLGASPIALGIVAGAVTLLHMAANRYVTFAGSKLQKAVLGRKVERYIGETGTDVERFKVDIGDDRESLQKFMKKVKSVFMTEREVASLQNVLAHGEDSLEKMGRVGKLWQAVRYGNVRQKKADFLRGFLEEINSTGTFSVGRTETLEPRSVTRTKSDMEMIEEQRKVYVEGVEEIFKRVESGQEYDTGELAGLFDRIILNVLTQFGIKDDVMVVGLGSYGRGVVPIGSDCDAVFIVRGAFPGLVKKDIQERVVWILEQIGLDVDPGALLPGDLKDWPTMDQLRAAFDEGVESGELVGINMLFLADNRLVSDADEKSIPEFGEYCRMRDEIITGKHPAFIAHLVLEIANFLRITGGTTPEAAGPSAGLIDIYYRYGDDKERIMQEIGKKIKSLYTVEDGELRLSPLGESEILRDIRQFNVKQDSGGMRSLDFVLWTGRVLSGVNDPDPYKIIEQLSAEYATGEEKEILRETMDYFIKLRSVINYISSLEKAEGTPEFIEHDTIDFNDISSIEQIVKVMEPQNELVRKIMSLEGQEQDIESELRKLSTIDTEDVEEKRRLSGERRSVRGELLKSRKELAGEFRGKVNSMRGKIAAIGLKALDKYLVSFIREGKIRDEDALYVMVPIGQRALLDLKRELKHRGEYRKDLARVMRERYRASRADLGKGVLGFIAAGVYKFTDTVMDLFGREKTPGYRAFVEDYFIPVIEEGAMFLVLRSWGTLPYFLIRPGFILAHAFQDRAPPGRRRTIFERIIIPALISVPAFSLPILALLGASPVVLGVVVGAVTLLHMAANRFVTLTGSRLQKAVLGKKFVQPPVRKARIISIRGEKVSDTYPVVPVTVREEAEPVPGVEFIATEEILDELMTDYPERILRDRGMDAEQYSRLAETAVVTNKKPIKVDPSGREWIGERYIIGRTPSGEDIELGRGGVAVVYYGLDTQSGDEIVLKVPEEERAVPGKEKLPFELKKMSLLREAAFIEYVKEQEKQGRVDLEGGVVDLRDAGVYRGAYLDDKGRPTGKEYTNYYIAMGYVHGLTLGDLLNQRGPLAEDEARALFERVYDTTRKLHKIGVIHMDIKSDNIFIPLVNGKLEFGKAVLGDFGFSIKVDNVDGQYVHDFTYGTEGYVPPEGGVGVFSGRNDMYALGMTLYEMMTGTVIEDGVKAEFTPDMESALPADLVAVVRLLTQENWEESSVLAEGVTGILERGKVAIADDVVLEDFEGFELEDMVLKLMKPGQKYSREEFKAEVEKLKLFLTRAIGVNLRQMAGDISEAKFGAGKRDGFKRFIVKKIRHAGRGDYKHALRVEADTDQGRQVFAVKFLKPKRPEYTFEGFKKMIKTEYENSRRLSETGLAADYYGEPYYVGERFDEKFSKGLEEHGILGLLVGEYVEGTPVSEIYERDERKEAYRGLVKATVRLWLETYDPETQAGLVLYDLAGRNYVLEDGTGRIKTIDPAFLDPFNVDYLRDMISALLIAELAMEKEGIRFDAMPGGADEMYFLSAIPEEINDYLREKGDSLDERKKRAVMELRGAEALRDIQVAVEEKIDLQKAIADASGRGDVIRMAELSDGKELEIHDAKALVRDDEEMFKELLAAVQKVVASSFGPSKAYGLAAELRIKQILQENEVMIAVVGNEVIGFLAYQFKPGEARSILDWFAVMQEHQGKGIGSRMMDEFMEVSLKARETGIEKAWWHSWDEKSDDFYIGYFRKKGIKPEQVGRNFTLGLDAVGAAMAPDHGAIMRGLRPEDVEEAITGDVDKSTLSEEFKAIEEMLDDSSLERNRTLRELADKLEIPWDLMLSRIKKARDDLLKGNKALKEFPAIVRGLDEYALGMATEDKITYSTEILAMLPAPLRAEYVLHEAICYYFPGLEGHQTARQIQMVLFPRNYGNLTPEEREELEGTEALTGDLTLFLSAFIDVTAPPLEGPPAERKAQEIYAQARMLAPALADAVRRGAPTYDIGPSFFRDMARDEQCNKEVARILGKKGHNIYARHCAFDPTKDTAAKWFENMVEDRPGGVLYDMLETFSRDASVDPRTRMTIRLIRGPDEAGNKARRKDMEGFILRNLKLMNPDLAERLETMSEAERNEWFNKHVKVLDVDVGNIEHVNPVLDLITDIGVMELDRYAKHDYEGKAPRDLEENLVRLLNLSIGSFVNIDTKQALKKVSRKDLYRVLAALFTGNMYIMVRKIDWGSIREKIRAQNAVLKSL